MSQPCYNSLWEAAASVPDAVLWTTGLRNSGLNLVMDRPENAGALFVVQDDGLAKCNVSEVFDPAIWPQGRCGQSAREQYLLLSKDEGRSLMMNHWLPGFGVDIPVGANTTISTEVNGADVGHTTLLATAASLAGEPPVELTEGEQVATSVRFLDEDHVALMDGVKQGLNSTGYLNATIVDERWLCDPSQGHVYVLDRALGAPESMPSVNATVLPGLEGYCDESLYEKLQSENNFREDSAMAMAAYTFPLVLPMTNPLLNITIFAPNFYPTSGQNGDEQTLTGAQLKNQIDLYVLLSTLPGGWCPSDFGTDGVVFNSLAGVLSNTSLVMLVRQDPVEAYKVHIELLFGSERSEATAYFMTKACHATIYRSLDVLDPWSGESGGFPNTSSVGYWETLPDASQESQFGAAGTCEPFVREGPGIIPESVRSGPTPTSTFVNESSESSSLSTGAIVGIVIGSLVGVALLLILLFVWWRKRGRGIHGQALPHWHRDSMSTKGSGGLMDLSDEGFGSRYSVNSISDFTLDDLVLKDSEVRLDRTGAGDLIVLGKGRFGKVYQGTLLDSEPVAVKCIMESVVLSPAGDAERMPSATPDDDSLAGRSDAGEPISFCDMSRDEIMKEIGVLKSCHSQFIVGFKGAMFRPHEVRLVTELMPSGNLWSALGHGTSVRSVTWYDSGIYIAMDVAAGLRYLHEKMRVIHLDLKSSNILLRDMQRFKSSSDSADSLSKTDSSGSKARQYTGVYQAKISDVGLSKILPVSREYLSSMEAGGTWNWCAPEVILNTKCNSSADVYSFGVVLWEICTGEIPVRGRMRPLRVPEECPQAVADLIQACLWTDVNQEVLTQKQSSKAMRRPTATECFELLSRMLVQE